MKPHSLSVLLLLSAMGIMPAKADVTYLANDVNAEDITASTRFYDTGKGYYWRARSLGTELEKEYEANNKSYAFLGDLHPYVSDADGDDFKIDQIEPLRKDMNTCWYQTISNVVTYWQTYYGVFYQGTGSNGTDSVLPTGYTYDKTYLSAFAGTQSLDVAMFFYDNWTDGGGVFESGVKWYMVGNNNDNITVKDHALLNDNCATASFFSEYFQGTSTVNSYTFGKYGGDGLSTSDITMENVTKAFREGFGFDGEGSTPEIGALAYMGATGAVGGHAITCYGFTTDDAGVLNSVWVTNSDDMEYSLFQLYVQLDENNELRLYTDAECETPWNYAGATDWVLDEIAFIDTPDSLKSMYEQYTHADNAQIWNGETEAWSADYAQQNGAEDLPAASTGWAVYVEEDVHTDYYNTWYNPTRGVEFDDYPDTNQTITVSGEVQAGAMLLSSHAVEYSFSGGADDSINVTSLSKTGDAKVSFALPELNVTGAAEIAAGTLELTGGTAMSAASVAVSYRGILSLNDASLTASTTTIGARSTLEIAAGGASMTTNLTLADGAIMSFILGDSNKTTAALTLTGSLTLDGNVSFLFNEDGLSETKYALISFKNDNGFSADALTNISLGSGTVSYENNILYYTYLTPKRHTWTGESGALTATYNSNNITFNTEAVVTVSGTVSPGELNIGKNVQVSLAGEGAVIKGTKGVSLAEGASLTTELQLTGRTITMGAGSTLTYTTTGSNTISDIDMAAGSELRLSAQSEEKTHTIQAAHHLDGNIWVAAYNHLTFHLDERKTISGTITTDSYSVLSFRNSSAGMNIDYELTSDPASIEWQINVGHAEDACGTTLWINPTEALSSISNTFNLAANGTLWLSGGTDAAPLTFDGTAKGSGTVLVTENSNVQFKNAALSSDTGLTVCGTVSLGSFSYTVTGSELSVDDGSDIVQGKISNHIELEGGSLTVHASAPYRATSESAQSISIDRLTLSDGGSALINYVLLNESYRPSDSDKETVNIGTVHVESGGGRIGAGYEGALYNPSLDIIPVHAISALTGSGDITFFKQIAGYETQTSITQIYDLSSFSGNITVESSLASATAARSLFLNTVELTQAGNMAGTVTVNGQSDDGTNTFWVVKSGDGKQYALNDPYHRAMLGLGADVKIGGLNGNKDAYLYAGELQSVAVSSATTYYSEIAYPGNTDFYDTEADRAEEANNIDAAITRAEHTLTTNNSADNDFAGTVLGGVSLVKDGSGTQRFSGDVSRFDGSITVREGTLHFSSSLDVNNLTLVAGSTLQVDGIISVSGDVRVEATSIAALRTVASAGEEVEPSFDGSVSLDADFDMSTAASLSLAEAIDLNGHQLTLCEAPIDLTLDINGLGESVSALTLMTSVGSIYGVDGTEWIASASTYFISDYITADTKLVYENQELKLTGLHTIPEPTTATLSLLALAALAARRRR